MKPTATTVRQKVLQVVLLTTLIAVLTASGAIIAFNLKAAHNDLIEDLTTQSELLGHMTAPALAFDDRKLATQNLNLFRFRPTIRAAALYTPRGELFASYRAQDDATPFPNGPKRDGVTVSDSDLVLYKSVSSEGEVLGTIYLRAHYDLLAKGLGYLGIAGVATALAMLVAFLFLLRLQHVVTAPILAIAKVARGVVESRDYSRRAEKISDDEVGVLAESFNDMLAEIERRTMELLRSNEEIARLNMGLEKRVRERTVELETANSDLVLAKASAENANHAKSAFLSSMSHELRTPLNAILGFTQLLASETIAVTPEKRQEFTGYILKAGNHLLVLINEILDLAKVESGTLTLSLEPVALAEVMQECEKMMLPMAQQRNIHVSFPADTGGHVIADRTRLKQILLNLLSNAVKYNRDGGAVSVETALVDARCIRIAVRDTGHGLSPAQMNEIFQPFNRLGQESGVEEGTGIGLVVTKRLVELMDGQIGMESSIGTGSVFWIELPLAATPREAVRAPALKRPAKADRLVTMARPVLYVEDNPANVRLVQELINLRPDLSLLTAADASLGIEMARAHQPELILMDLNLPGISGTKALSILQRDPATAHIPVIALTANAMHREAERGLAAGFIRYLTKPIDIDSFFEAVDFALTKSAETIDSDGPTRRPG